MVSSSPQPTNKAVLSRLKVMPRGRAQVGTVATMLLALSRTVMVLLFSLVTKIRPVPFAKAGRGENAKRQAIAAALSQAGVFMLIAFLIIFRLLRCGPGRHENIGKTG